jgi:hypothetical protein
MHRGRRATPHEAPNPLTAPWVRAAWGNLRRPRSSDVSACIDFVAAPWSLPHGAPNAGNSAYSDRLLSRISHRTPAARADLAALTGVLGLLRCDVLRSTTRSLATTFARHHRHLQPLATDPGEISGLVGPRSATASQPHMGPITTTARCLPEACTGDPSRPVCGIFRTLRQDMGNYWQLTDQPSHSSVTVMGLPGLLRRLLACGLLQPAPLERLSTRSSLEIGSRGAGSDRSHVGKEQRS